MTLELILAARWRGLRDEEFEALPLESQARVLAAYRTTMLIEAVQMHHPPNQKKRRR